MHDRLPPADLSRVRTLPLADRPSKVSVERFARPVGVTRPLGEYLDGLPDLLAVRELRGLARSVVRAAAAGAPVVWALGGHVVKVGVGPVLVSLMERGWIQALAMNGATAIHDWEIAATGATSEDVASGLADGTFGMATETGNAINGAAREAQDAGVGLGEALVRRVGEAALPYDGSSLLAAAHRLGVPVTVHVAIGGDVVHQHPGADGAAIGAASHTDFRRLVTLVSGLEGGVWINCGSAVLLPEVFLKALATARNLGGVARRFTTADLDMQRHYRPRENVLLRPTAGAGESFQLLGHHELNVPLLAAAIEAEALRSREV